MINIKLDYFSLLSPEPITFENIGSVISPTLQQISKLKYKYNTYQNYLSVLLIDIKSYYEIMDKMGEMYFVHYSSEQKDKILSIRREYESMTEEQRKQISFFSILVFDEILRDNVIEALNFFMLDLIIFSKELQMFFTYNYDVPEDYSKPTGYINQNNYEFVIDVILQRICVEKQEHIEDVKVKNKTAARLLEKIKQGNKKKQKKQDKKMELANLISALASHSKNLNIVNIWDLTVYQLYDQFRRQMLEDYYEINSSHIAAWGDSENKFDSTSWLSLINEN